MRKRLIRLPQQLIGAAENRYMQAAIEEAYRGIVARDGGPFGAIVVRDGEVIGRGHNRVIGNNDPTCHGEIDAIRNACATLKTHDLSGCQIYTTGEPCPMCLFACKWANIEAIYYGGTIEDNRTWFYCEKPYIFLDNIYLRGRTNIPYLTLKPGVSIKFANDKGMQVGDYFNWSGEYYHSGTINAIGTPDSLITFSALNDSIGGWNGIYFNPYSDDRGGECYLTY
ncbi:MAG: nucleoside deaminase, partial [Erysipelotrichaceae bacterium]|nr:nucleoside deaminase [Erysipelotrichaceae bacterium]